MNYCIRCLEAAEPRQQSVVHPPRREAWLGIPTLIAAFFLSVLAFVSLGWMLSLLRTWSGGGVTQG